MSEAHESRDIAVRPIAWAIAALFTTIALASGLLYWIYPTRTPAFEPPATEWTARVEDSTHLQTNPPRELEQLRREQKLKLQSYGWVDRRQGIARIPIEQAIALLPRHRPELVIEHRATHVEAQSP